MAGCSANADPRHTGADFLAFLTRLARVYRGRELHVVVDNSSTHSTPAVQAWLATHPTVHLHFTPKGASWLNMIEAWFGILTRKSVRRGSFETVRALIRTSSSTSRTGMITLRPSSGPRPPRTSSPRLSAAVVNMTSRTAH